MGGSLALGAHNGLDPDHLELGKRLTETCFQMYIRMPTGLSPEIVYFNQAEGGKEDIIVKVNYQAGGGGKGDIIIKVNYQVKWGGGTRGISLLR